MNDGHPYEVWPMKGEPDTWVIGPVPDPRKGDREWSYTTEVEVECPRCGTPVDVPVIVYASTNGDSMVVMHAATSANPSHDCDDESREGLDSYEDPFRADESLVVVQPYDDTEPEVVVP